MSSSRTTNELVVHKPVNPRRRGGGVGARVIIFIAIAIAVPSTTRADEANIKALTAALEKFTLPEMPDDVKQQLRDYVPNDLKARRDAANKRSTAEWEKITTKEEWEAFRQEKLKKLRVSLGRSFAGDDWKPPQVIGKPEISGTIKGEGYRIDKIIYGSAYGQWITANLYVPEPGTPGKESAREKMPGFIISHAHHTPKEQGELQDMGVLWARAGCYVLVPDHLGHGERRQHPFKSKADYDKDFQVSRQDYYFRYDLNLQLNIAGESLMGCLALDLMSGVSVLLNQTQIDAEKIIMLGAVAGGGDPCAVAAALDERITCAAPFNFGGPQPETKYPLPPGVEFNYGGSGGWESTRNLAFSYRDGFLPWVIVGSIAPRRLIYGHEFSWDREHDPVWARFEKIYAWYGKPDHLSSTHGQGTLTSKDPPGSHCTHIGKIHRKQMHVALAKWFDIKLPGGEESTDRHDAAELRCWTDEMRAKLKPKPLQTELRAISNTPLKIDGYNSSISVFITEKVAWSSRPTELPGVKAEQLLIRYNERELVPLLILHPTAALQQDVPAVLVITRAAKQTFVRERAALIATLLDAGISVALPDLYNTGSTGAGSDLGRRSSNTGRSSTLAMFGVSLHTLQVQDAHCALTWLQAYRSWDPQRIALWSDSLIPPNTETNYRIPRDDDGQLPPCPDPLPARVAHEVAAIEVAAFYARGAVNSLDSAFDQPMVLLPHDAVPLPRFSRLSKELPKTLAIRQDQTVDALNREVPPKDGKPEDHDPKTAAAWIITQLKAPR